MTPSARIITLLDQIHTDIEDGSTILNDMLELSQYLNADLQKNTLKLSVIHLSAYFENIIKHFRNIRFLDKTGKKAPTDSVNGYFYYITRGSGPNFTNELDITLKGITTLFHIKYCRNPHQKVYDIYEKYSEYLDIPNHPTPTNTEDLFILTNDILRQKLRNIIAHSSAYQDPNLAGKSLIDILNKDDIQIIGDIIFQFLAYLYETWNSRYKKQVGMVALTPASGTFEFIKKHKIYFCQKGRTFRNAENIGFYVSGEIRAIAKFQSTTLPDIKKQKNGKDIHKEIVDIFRQAGSMSEIGNSDYYILSDFTEISYPWVKKGNSPVQNRQYIDLQELEKYKN